MRVAPVTPPYSRPTSPALGPAVLSAYLKDNAPDLEVQCFDLNLSFYLSILQAIDQELILTDLVVVEKKLEHMGLEKKRGKKADPEIKLPSTSAIASDPLCIGYPYSGRPSRNFVIYLSIFRICCSFTTMVDRAT